MTWLTADMRVRALREFSRHCRRRGMLAEEIEALNRMRELGNNSYTLASARQQAIEQYAHAPWLMPDRLWSAVYSGP